MGRYVERAKELRETPTIHTYYNCGQAVLVAFAEEMGMTEEQAFLVGAHLGAGMRHGSVCGALSGAMVALGPMGYSEAEAKAVLQAFRQTHGETDCKALLRTSLERGESKKDHCNGLVYEMAAALEMLKQRES